MEIHTDFEIICVHYLELLTKIEKINTEDFSSKALQKELCIQLHQLEKEIILQSQIHMK